MNYFSTTGIEVMLMGGNFILLLIFVALCVIAENLLALVNQVKLITKNTNDRRHPRRRVTRNGPLSKRRRLRKPFRVQKKKKQSKFLKNKVI
ncbi:hypothetical protein QUF70_11265 [Desulfobacterales bacterium HSG17]|nr:hypothetical protein [Desulfobacterales bacterium HSG17]